MFGLSKMLVNAVITLEILLADFASVLALIANEIRYRCPVNESYNLLFLLTRESSKVIQSRYVMISFNMFANKICITQQLFMANLAFMVNILLYEIVELKH